MKAQKELKKLLSWFENTGIRLEQVQLLVLGKIRLLWSLITYWIQRFLISCPFILVGFPLYEVSFTDFFPFIKGMLLIITNFRCVVCQWIKNTDFINILSAVPKSISWVLRLCHVVLVSSKVLVRYIKFLI